MTGMVPMVEKSMAGQNQQGIARPKDNVADFLPNPFPTAVNCQNDGIIGASEITFPDGLTGQGRISRDHHFKAPIPWTTRLVLVPISVQVPPIMVAYESGMRYCEAGC